MKLIATDIDIKFDSSGAAELVLTVPSTKDAKLCYDKLKPIVGANKRLTAEIKQYRCKRSLDSNSYAWVLIGKIADVVNASKEEVYTRMLERYGQREEKLISVVSEAVDMVFRATNNHCSIVGESELGDKVFVHLAILIGSSKYDSKQMTTLIDGIVSECKELDIETLPPEELEAMNMKWRNGDEQGNFDGKVNKGSRDKKYGYGQRSVQLYPSSR